MIFRRIYKYLILDDVVTGTDLCIILWEQDVIQLEPGELDSLRSGSKSSYAFMRGLISDIRITPAQLGLEPCSGSVRYNRSQNGEVLAWFRIRDMTITSWQILQIPYYLANLLSMTGQSLFGIMQHSRRRHRVQHLRWSPL